MIRSSRFLSLVLAAISLAALSSTARAQDVEALRRRLLLAPVSGAPGGLADLFRGAPGTNTGTPLAFGPGMGDFFVGGGYQSRIRTTKKADGTWNSDNGTDDGSISFGFGLGDANDGLGLTVVLTSLSTFRSGIGNRTAGSFQVFRNINPRTAIAVGVENAFISGGGKTDAADSWYGVLSHVYQQPSADMAWLKAITVSGGVGNGRFQQIDDFSAGKDGVNVFGSVAFLVHEQVSFIGDYTGQDINLGMSVVPFKKFPVTITPSLADLTGTANKGARFVLGAGVGMHF